MTQSGVIPGVLPGDITEFGQLLALPVKTVVMFRDCPVKGRWTYAQIAYTITEPVMTRFPLVVLHGECIGVTRRLTWVRILTYRTPSLMAGIWRGRIVPAKKAAGMRFPLTA